jgi:hypothetical protein
MRPANDLYQMGATGFEPVTPSVSSVIFPMLKKLENLGFSHVKRNCMVACIRLQWLSLVRK